MKTKFRFIYEVGEGNVLSRVYIQYKWKVLWLIPTWSYIENLMGFRIGFKNADDAMEFLKKDFYAKEVKSAEFEIG